MRLSFDSVDEVRDFVKNHLKGSRGGKADKDEGETTGNAPAPAMPGQAAPTFNPGGAAFAPPADGAAQGGAFPAHAAPTINPAVTALVQRITTRGKAAVASGQPAEVMLSWFRTQCGPEAANYTQDQIDTIALPKMSVPALEQIAKLMNA